VGPELIDCRAIAPYCIVHKYKFRASLIIIIIIIIIITLNRQLSRGCREGTVLPSLPLGGKPS
jgi:hypothetical protein